MYIKALSTKIPENGLLTRQSSKTAGKQDEYNLVYSHWGR